MSQIRPGFSVTSALALPGRKAIAQGLSKVATSDVLNGGPLRAAADASELPDCAEVGPDAPQAATASKREACIKRMSIPTVSRPKGNLWGCHTV
jgi:hypothetical protein